MNRTSIKIIKRQNAEVVAIDETRDTPKPKLVATTSGKKIERGSHRMMADTVSNWIAECRENNRAEEVSSMRRMFGSEFLLSNTA